MKGRRRCFNWIEVVGGSTSFIVDGKELVTFWRKVRRNSISGCELRELTAVEVESRTSSIK